MLGQSQAVTPVTLARFLTFGNLRGDGCAVQLTPVLYSREGTADKVVRTIHELGRQELQFATFPETVVPLLPYCRARRAA
jgi:hypothetical protein